MKSVVVSSVIYKSIVSSARCFIQDGLWVGKSTQKEDEEFTVDTARYPNITKIISSLHEKDRKLLVDTRPAILVRWFFW